MVKSINLNNASVVGHKGSSSLHSEVFNSLVYRTPPTLVPIRSLGENHTARITSHLLLLDAHDRYLRFGFAASDAHIHRYVNGLNFERDEIFGIYNRRVELIAMAHLARAPDDELKSCAEFGVSVAGASRGRGYGSRLFDRALMHARNDGITCLFIHVLTENEAMLKIANNAGASVECNGPESQAFVYLEPATLDTRMTELVEEKFAQADYHIKVKTKQFGDLLSEAQSLRRDMHNVKDFFQQKRSG